MDNFPPAIRRTRSVRSLPATLALVLGLAIAFLAPAAAPAAVADTVCQPPVTLQSCITATAPGGVVLVAPTTWTESVTIDKALTLRGVTYQTTILQAPPGKRVITITGSGAVHLEHLTIQGGAPIAPDTGGGGIKSATGDLYISDCLVRNNAGSYGGGLFQQGSAPAPTVYVDQSRFEGNSAGVHGGALLVWDGNLVMSNTQISGNTAGSSGGGAAVWSGAASISGGTITGNHANLNGGGVNVNNAITVQNTVISGNSAGGNGGGLLQWNAGQGVSITGATFTSNTAGAQGGGMWAKGSTGISGATFESNSINAGGASVLAGAGLCLDAAAPPSAGPLMISNSAFVSNTLTSSGTGPAAGAGLYANSLATSISGSQFIGNQLITTNVAASAKGAGVDAATGPLAVTNSTFQANQITAAPGTLMVTAGGIEADHLALVTVGGSKFIGNKGWFGGGLSCDYVTRCVVEDSQFDSNKAGYGAGIDSLTVEVRRSSFTNNIATNEGAALTAGPSMSVERTRITNNNAYLSTVWATGALTLTNVLLADNTNATGGADLHIERPNLTRSLKHVTIAAATRKTSAGIILASNVITGLLRMDNTIIANHAIGVKADGGFLLQNYNLYGLNTSNFTGLNGGNVGMLFGDPLFTNPAAGDYHIRPGSPAINAGADLGILIDLDGNPRLGRPDIGAYEWIAHLWLPVLMR